MNEKYLTNLELSKRLKELGVPQRSEFWWFEDRRFVKFSSKKWKDLYSRDWGIMDFKITDDCISAYLSDELLEWLPEEINFRKHTYRLAIGKNDKYFAVWYDSEQLKDKSRLTLNEENENILPNALAKMLIYLIEQGIINSKDSQ